ncbi:response regulator transcription factor [Streptosporangium sp. NPDC051022]|uniref:response regulator transcription factor n=1 Tax=Streptosporangium sp. NPDC051022 TaxID=3155752 RepID=UPI003440748E
MIEVLVADDHALVRTGFRMVLDAQDGMTVVGEAGDGEEALRRTRELLPDVVLMDPRMPGAGGVTGVIAAELPEVRILALSASDLDEYVVDALLAGASGFLPKDVSPEELAEGVRVVHREGSAAAPGSSPGSFPRPAGGFAGLPRPRRVLTASMLAGLTDRERQVLVLVAGGRSDAEIRETLRLPASTVRDHVGSLVAKLGARDRAPAVIAAYEAGLLTPGEALRR